MTPIVFNISSPFVTASRYSEMTGLTVGSVETKIKLGHLPTVKQGKSRLINVAKLMKEALDEQI